MQRWICMCIIHLWLNFFIPTEIIIPRFYNITWVAIYCKQFYIANKYYCLFYLLSFHVYADVKRLNTEYFIVLFLIKLKKFLFHFRSFHHLIVTMAESLYMYRYDDSIRGKLIKSWNIFIKFFTNLLFSNFIAYPQEWILNIKM